LMLLLWLSAFSAAAQDMHFSQYLSSPANVNPALSGLFDGDYRFVANHRNQWSSVSVPYTSFSGSADMKLRIPALKREMFGAAFLINSDKAGDSEFGTTHASLSFSYIKRMNKDSSLFVSLGLLGGFTQRSINYQKLTFDNQYNGDFFDPSASSGEVFVDTRFVYFDLSSGINVLYSPKGKYGFNLGFSLSHLNRPVQTFFGNDEIRLHRKYLFHISGTYKLNNKIQLIPSLLYEKQNTLRELVFGSSVKLSQLTKNLDSRALYLGLHFRTSDALILSTGIDYNDLNIGFSYDINTSDLRPASHGRGAYEISLIYILRKFKPLTTSKKFCPPYM
jgi:type IX secretion system PorP/SprF family membrane protein